MTIKIVNSLPEDIWRRFVDVQPAGNIFHTPEMFQVFAQTENHMPTLWAAIDSNGNPLALVVPVKISLTNGLLRGYTTRAVVYGSVLSVPGPDGQKALLALLDALKAGVKENCLFTELRNLTDLGDSQLALQSQGFVFEPHLNFIVHLDRTVEELAKSMNRNVMSNVRRARRMGVTIEDVGLPEIPSIYTVLKKVYQRIEVPLAPLSLFESAFQVLSPKEMIKIIAARVEGEYIGVAIRLLYKDTIFAWYAGALRSYSKYKAHDFLNWHILEWGARNGYKFFDFGGGGRPDESYGPRDYKSKFGGVLVNYGRNTLIHSPLRLKVSNFSYKILRKVLYKRN